MKRLITLLLSVMMIFALAACSDTGKTSSGSSTTDPATSQQEQAGKPDESKPSGGEAAPDLGTVQGLLDYYGIKADSMKPDSFVEFKAISLENRYKEIQIVFTDDYSMELYKSLGAALFETTQSAADDGKCYKLTTTNALSAEDADANGYGSGWWYTLNGKKLEVHLSKDTDDDDKDIIIIGLTDYDL